jgi:signal peptidase I
MKRYSLEIAGYIINFETVTDNISLYPSPRFKGFVTDNNSKGILIRVYKGECPDIQNGNIVFSAPYVEEINGIKLKVKTEFWKILRNPDNIFIKTYFPFENQEKSAVLSVPNESNSWSMWISGSDEEIDPLAYPMDGLLLYYLTAINGDLMIHGSGISYKDKGYIFSGVSGSGKSTMARLWKEAGAKVVHDDRLIIRKVGKEYCMHNTPVYDDEIPEHAHLDKIFLLGHGNINKEIKITGADAVTSILSNCIQHNWEKNQIDRSLGTVRSLCETVNVSRLEFLPDPSIITFIGENAGNPDITAEGGLGNKIEQIEALKDLGVEILSTGTSLLVVANGYSMYPTLKPGSKIVINKVQNPVLGDIIAIDKDGKLIVHRLIKIIKDTNSIYYIARGDSNMFPDPPVGIENIVGKVASMPNKTEIPESRYKINRFLAKLASIRDRIKKLFN